MIALVALASAEGQGPSDRLSELIAAHGLGTDGLVDLAVTRPDLAWQLLDPASRAAVTTILGMPAADIRAIRQGQAIIHSAREATDAEWSGVSALAEALGLNPRRVHQIHAHTADNRLIRVDLELRGDTRGVSVAWPADLTPPAVSAELRARGLATEAPVLLLDGGFEDPWSAGLAWQEVRPPGTLIARDIARVRAGTSSIHLESHTRAVPTLTQRLALVPGEHVTLSGYVAHEGPPPSVGLRFEGTPDVDENPAELRQADASGWRAVWLEVTVPKMATSVWLDVALTGPGTANIDDLTLHLIGPSVAAITTWERASSGPITAHADPTRCGAAVGTVTCSAALAARLEAAMLSGLGLLSLPSSGAVDVWVFGDAAHRDALVTRGPGGPRGFQDDSDGGLCWTLQGSPWAAACPLQVMIERAWGKPGNHVLGQGLPRALAGSGVDLAQAVRANLADVPPLTQLATSRVGGPSREAAITSFSAWLLATQSLAAVRAAWKAEDLTTYSIAGKDMSALEREWRAALGG